jgi:pyruvate formate lyase activating enzyme
MDAANVDLKGFTDDFYVKLCGARLLPVLDTLKYLVHETDVWTEITTLLIPGKNDSDAELTAMCDWLARELTPDVPLHFTAFHPDYKLLDVPPTPPATLARARRIAQANGIRYAYTGNVHDSDGGSTYCHACGARLIERDWYTLGAWELTPDGRCRRCGTPCAGRFDAVPGTWGAKRLPVRLADFEARP